MPVQELKLHSLPGARYLTNVMFCFEQSMLTVILFFATTPSSPTNVSAIKSLLRYFLVEWNEPLEPNGIVRYYVIIVYESDSSLVTGHKKIAPLLTEVVLLVVWNPLPTIPLLFKLSPGAGQ